MDKNKKNLAWFGRPIFSEGDVPNLERAAAMYEFGYGLSREEAEERAHTDYRRKYHAKAAAHHLTCLNVARSEGSFESAAQHAQMVQEHMKAMGYGPYDPIPPEIEQLASQNQTEKVEFAPHEADSFLTYAEKGGLTKSQRIH